MSYVNCSSCGIGFNASCSCQGKCEACVKKVQDELLQKIQEQAEERRLRIESGEIKPVNVADLDPEFCRNCGVPKKRCNCKFNQ